MCWETNLLVMMKMNYWDILTRNGQPQIPKLDLSLSSIRKIQVMLSKLQRFAPSIKFRWVGPCEWSCGLQSDWLVENSTVWCGLKCGGSYFHSLLGVEHWLCEDGQNYSISSRWVGLMAIIMELRWLWEVWMLSYSQLWIGWISTSKSKIPDFSYH